MVRLSIAWDEANCVHTKMQRNTAPRSALTGARREGVMQVAMQVDSGEAFNWPRLRPWTSNRQWKHTNKQKSVSQGCVRKGCWKTLLLGIL